MNNLSVIFPGTFRMNIAPEKVDQLPYSLTLLATNKITGEQHWVIESNSEEGIQSFKDSISDIPAEFLNAHNYKGVREDWEQNAFPTFQNDARTPFEVLEAGREALRMQDLANHPIVET